MDTLLLISYLVFILFGFLQIILFFKLWRMANSVEYIKLKIKENNPTVDIRQYLLKKDYEKAYNAIFDLFIKDVAKERCNYSTWKTFEKTYHSLVKLYTPWFENVNRLSGIKRMPDFNNIINESNFRYL